MTILLAVPYPTNKTCDICGSKAWWDLLPGDLGIVSQLCDEHLKEFQRRWQQSGVETAARMLPKVRTVAAAR